jgi:hypothetical protein
MNEQLKAMLASYGRSVLGAVIALYMSGVTDPQQLVYALVAALAPVALRYINPNDKAFGRLPKVEEVEVALKAVKKAPAKRAVAKKPASK